MTPSTSLTSSLGSIFSWGGQSSETLLEKRAMAVSAVPYVNCLPIEILHRIFMEVIENDNYDFSWIGVLSCVCWRWNCACKHTVMWEFISKRIFVAYPLVQRLHSAPLDQSEMQLLNRMRRLGAPEQFITQHDIMEPLIAPTNRTVREAMEEVKHYLKSRSYYEYVQRRRVFVLHMFVSWALLMFSLFTATTVCSAEGLALGALSSPNMAFFFLWMTYFSIIIVVLANVVMETHFEPKPLFCRLRKNKPLITSSATSIAVGIACVALPTLLVQINFSRKERFPWLICGITPIASLDMWQLYVLLSYIVPDVKRQITEQRTVFRPKAVVMFVLSNIPYVYPALFAGTIFCILQYVEYGGRIYVLFAIVPVLTSLVVLTLLFLLDFFLTRHLKDLVTGGCLFIIMIFPLSLMWWEFRGFSLLPVTIASFLFYLTHLRLVAMRALQEIIEGALRPQKLRRLH
ncbi:hypothetical protein TraAM80_06818 [Trypanosoma rangeli]|uniref:F-box domain-containing protein n=1 Tax=Trypanosoma rangeli TaxID=5698 RepID=A0A422N8A5_TRYRA|nr:uncharacterized protein TraAM80_06818 [Trypanosoma rangeli]RNF01695.1 hypothetical protein TraAM80_06818 [Trypanosoma rangeli]|eukprot:RNF01695.1 hypothetical protein TraAM80_06818 [Trypanosoma rangeli]